MKSVAFRNRTWDVAAELHLPVDFDESRKYPAIVCVHPGSSCKGQTAGLYASKLAEQGFVAIAFDGSFQGESGGEPRYIEDPVTRVEDVRCAVDYLVTLPCVDEEKIGVLGVCAGGGYAVNAAMTEHRIKAVGTVVAANIGKLYRSYGAAGMLEAIGKQRTAEARGAEPLINTWIPNSEEERKQAGMDDIDLVQAVDYYRTPRGQNECAPNRLRFTSLGSVLAFDAFHLVEELLIHPSHPDGDRDAAGGDPAPALLGSGRLGPGRSPARAPAPLPADGRGSGRGCGLPRHLGRDPGPLPRPRARAAHPA